MASQAPARATLTIQPWQHCPPHGQDQAKGRAKEEEVRHVEVQAAQADLRELEPPCCRGLGLIRQHTRVDAARGRQTWEGGLGEDPECGVFAQR